MIKLMKSFFIKINNFGIEIFAFILFLIVVGWYHAYFKINHWDSDSVGKLGALGDYVGGLLNPIFAFFAFLILMRSFRLQAQELVKVSSAQEKQLEQINRQNFESLFFRLIDLKSEKFDAKVLEVVRFYNKNPKFEKPINFPNTRLVIQTIIEELPNECHLKSIKWDPFAEYIQNMYMVLRDLEREF